MRVEAEDARTLDAQRLEHADAAAQADVGERDGRLAGGRQLTVDPGGQLPDTHACTASGAVLSARRNGDALSSVSATSSSGSESATMPPPAP